MFVLELPIPPLDLVRLCLRAFGVIFLVDVEGDLVGVGVEEEEEEKAESGTTDVSLAESESAETKRMGKNEEEEWREDEKKHESRRSESETYIVVSLSPNVPRCPLVFECFPNLRFWQR
jgi:hypothetical protein